MLPTGLVALKLADCIFAGAEQESLAARAAALLSNYGSKAELLLAACLLAICAAGEHQEIRVEWTQMHTWSLYNWLSMLRVSTSATCSSTSERRWRWEPSAIIGLSSDTFDDNESACLAASRACLSCFCKADCTVKKPQRLSIRQSCCCQNHKPLHMVSQAYAETKTNSW